MHLLIYPSKSPWVSGDNLRYVLIRNERVDDVGEHMDHPVAGVDVKCLDPLPIHSHKTLIGGGRGKG